MKKEITREFNIRMLEFKYENEQQEDVDGDFEVEMTFKDIKRLARKLTEYINKDFTKKQYKNWSDKEFFLQDSVRRVTKWEWEL